MPQTEKLTKLEIARRIRDKQSQAKMKDSELASRANLALSALSHYRSGRSRPRPETVIALAIALSCHPTELDPSLEDEFKRDASWFIEAASETRALFQKWNALSNEIQISRADLISTLKTLQEHSRFIEAQIQEQQAEMEKIERALNVRMAEMKRKQKILEAIAGYSGSAIA